MKSDTEGATIVTKAINVKVGEERPLALGVGRNQEGDMTTEQREEIVIQGRLRESVEVPELGLAIEVSWTDGRRFRAAVLPRTAVTPGSGGRRSRVRKMKAREE